jgi:choline transporter-like protein 2/4/5
MGLCRCYHNCCGNDKANEVYTPRRERWCTDVLCLVLLILAWGGMGTLGYMCAADKPQLLWKLYYPTDSYGQFCGRSGSATEHLPVAFYADLDADIEEHWVDLVAGRYVTFLGEVTTLCAARCPDGVSLTEPTAYGGAGYPLGLTEDGVELSSRSTTVPTYFYSFRTEAEPEPGPEPEPQPEPEPEPEP